MGEEFIELARFDEHLFVLALLPVIIFEVRSSALLPHLVRIESTTQQGHFAYIPYYLVL